MRFWVIIWRAHNYQFVMRYWVRTVSDSIMRTCGVMAMTAVSSFLTIRLTVQTWMSVFLLLDHCVFHLGVKRVELQLVGALEGLCVDLLKGDPVVFPLKDVDLLNIVVLAAHKIALPGEGELGVLCALQEDLKHYVEGGGTLVASFLSVLSNTKNGIHNL